MKANLFYFFIICSLLTVSCVTTDYVFENTTQTTGVDFTKGKWLLHTIEAPYEIEEQLNKLSFEDFTDILNDRIVSSNDAKKILLPRAVRLSPSKNELKNLKLGTDFDYFINIKAKNIINDLNSISLTNHNYRNNETTKNEVVLEIYDLNNATIIYTQKVIASIKIPEESNSDVHFSKSSNAMIIRAYKKLMKDLNKKSIK
jgi:hypothetical protein